MRIQPSGMRPKGIEHILILVAISIASTAWAEDEGDLEVGIELTVSAGRFDRDRTPVQISIQPGDISEALAKRLDQLAHQGQPLTLVEVGHEGDRPPILAQVDHPNPGVDTLRIVWVLNDQLPAGGHRTYRGLIASEPLERPSPWSFSKSPEGHLELSNRESPVFRYNTSPVRHPDHSNEHQPRDAYIHPAFAPSGAVVTGDYSAESHPHHRGFFLAYTKTEVGALKPDFWNIQNGTGKVAFDRLGSVEAGPVTARFSTFHHWWANRPDAEPVEVLRERWDVEAFDIPGSPYWLIDLTSSQIAVEKPMVLPPYRYGGMAYRGPDSFFPEGALDVLTSEGHDRVQGDQKPARWVDLTGPIDSGSTSYAGAAIFDHPSNLHHPTPARIHPTRLPFFCFVPSHDETVTIRADAPTVFRYRILIHDDHPEAARNDRLWRDFAGPPRVTLSERDS